MSHRTVSHTITYRKSGTKPPVYLAGSFTEPKWEPREMQYIQLAGGDYLFTSQVNVLPGREYQFKFKVGQGDSWDLDEKNPVVTDAMGNENNILRVHPENTTDPNSSLRGKLLNELGIVELSSRSSTPHEPAASTAAEMADMAQNLRPIDFGQSRPDDGEPEYSLPDQQPIRTPLFAHECLGAYEPLDDALEISEPLTQTRSIFGGGEYFPNQVDVNDPTIEKFPSDRGSVMDALRKIQSSLSEDPVHLEEGGTSPRWVPRRDSIDSAEDSCYSTESLSPKSLAFPRRREPRLSHGNYGQTKSAVSLGSIAEEPKDRPPPNYSRAGVALAEPRGSALEGSETPPSDLDDGFMMGGTKVLPRMKYGEVSPFSDHEDEQEAVCKGRETVCQDGLLSKWLGFMKLLGLRSCRPARNNSEMGESSHRASSKESSSTVAPSEKKSSRWELPRAGHPRLVTLGFVLVSLSIAWWEGKRFLKDWDWRNLSMRDWSVFAVR